MLAQLAVTDPESFTKVVELATAKVEQLVRRLRSLEGALVIALEASLAVVSLGTSCFVAEQHVISS